MIKIKEDIERLYGFIPNDTAISKLIEWQKLFINYNSHTNLMSKNDISILFEKHVLDCLSITLLKDFKDGIKLLDIGCGGGFPCLILAIFFENINITGLDSIQKKTKFLEIAKKELDLNNFEIINGRFEKITPQNADILTNRAVGKITDVWKMAGHHLKKEGYFVSYKALTAHNEAQIAQKNFKELKNLKFYPYSLPLKENFTRELVVFQKQ